MFFLFVFLALCLFIVGWWGVGLGGWVVFLFFLVFIHVFVCFLFVFLFVNFFRYLLQTLCLSLEDSNMSGVNGGHPRVVPGKV